VFSTFLLQVKKLIIKDLYRLLFSKAQDIITNVNLGSLLSIFESLLDSMIFIFLGLTHSAKG